MTKNEIILLSIYILSKGEKKIVKNEDVIVHTFKLFPEKFQLPGYPDYPDTGYISKRLYDELKPRGYLRTAKRRLQLTGLGIEVGKKLLQRFEGQTEKNIEPKMLQHEFSEYQRLISLKGFNLFLNDPDNDPLDIDIYDFYNISVRTNKPEVKGRFNIVAELLKKARSIGFKYSDEIVAYKKRLDRLYKEISRDENKS